MIVSGSNITTKNKSGQSREVQLKSYGIEAEFITTKRGIRMTLWGETKIVQNGQSFLLLAKDAEVHDFEKEIHIPTHEEMDKIEEKYND